MQNILIADDDTTLRTALTRYLKKRNFEVWEAGSGQEALNLFQEKTPDLIVSDVMMPEMDGFEFCRQVRRSGKGQLIPFLFLSTRGELDDRVQGHLLGGDDYLIKPFEPRELLAKIEAQLERSRRVHAEIDRLVQQSPLDLPPEPPKPLPLTPAEERVFWEVIQGYTNRQIGENLYISPRTVQTHISSILNKLNLENRSQLVRFAYEKGYRSEDNPHKADTSLESELD